MVLLHLTVNPLSPKCQPRYQKLERLGSGAFGVVYKAKNIITGELVAMKVPKNKIGPGKKISSLDLEASILLSLNHENIVRLKHVFVEEGHVQCKVFELLDYNLEEIIKCTEIDISEAQAAYVMKQLVQGVDFCHQKQILHRDIKSGNILVSHSGIVKLGDFGISCSIADYSLRERSITNALGSVWYLPPELLNGKGCQSDGTEMDIWSLGCVMLELFERTVLFGSKTSDEQLAIMNALSDTQSIPLSTMKPKSSADKDGSIKVVSIQLTPALERISVTGRNLLYAMLSYDGNCRISASDALVNPWLCPPVTQSVEPINFGPLGKEIRTSPSARKSSNYVSPIPAMIPGRECRSIMSRPDFQRPGSLESGFQKLVLPVLD